jgi:tRNA(Arg) A34 adenosine deaminase TadA
MVSKKKEKIFSRAMEEAEKSQMLFKHGCIATCGGKIIASGFNKHKSLNGNDLFMNNQCSCHAEINVLKKIYIHNYMKQRKLHKIMKKTTLYICRNSKTLENVNSAPCEKCMKLIKMFKIKRIIFTQNSLIYNYKTNNYHTQHKTFGDTYLIQLKK